MGGGTKTDAQARDGHYSEVTATSPDVDAPQGPFDSYGARVWLCMPAFYAGRRIRPAATQPLQAVRSGQMDDACFSALFCTSVLPVSSLMRGACITPFVGLSEWPLLTVNGNHEAYPKRVASYLRVYNS